MSHHTLCDLDGRPRSVEQNLIDELKLKLRGPLLRPGDAGYDAARRIWNGVHDIRPGLLISATGVADVIDTVNFAREHGLRLSIRGGGHNVAGTSLCEGGVTLDLSGLRQIRVDPAERIADVGPGATLGDLDRETQAFGLAAPAGIVSTTGVAGLTLGGGMGWLRRKHGLTIDNLLSVDIVTADGTFRRADEATNADLFWAVRGGGGNFGVVTSFRFRLHPLGPLVYLAAPIYPVEMAAEILPRWREICDGFHDDAGAFAFFQTLPAAEAFPKEAWNREVLALPAVYAGAVDRGEPVLAPLRKLGTPLLDLSGPIPFRALQQAFDWVFPSGNRYYWKTATIRTLDDAALAAIRDLGMSRSSPQTVVGIWQMGGAINRVADDATGYGPRHDPWTVNIDSGWTSAAEDERHIEWTRSAAGKLSSLSGGRMYIHYGALEDEDHLRTAYGNTYERLSAIKATYDPLNLFRVNQNIRPKP